MDNDKTVKVTDSTFLQDQFQVQALVQKPIKYIENYWGQELRRSKERNIDNEMSFWPKFGKDRLNMGSLPYSSSPRLRKNTSDRMIPLDTQMGCSKACWNEALAQAGPWYLRHWQIWDTAPIKPSAGDLSKDPRFGIQTRQFTKPYKTNGV